MTILRSYDVKGCVESLAGVFSAADPKSFTEIIASVIDEASVVAANRDRTLVELIQESVGHDLQPPASVAFFHGTRATDPDSFLEGLRPLRSTIDEIWAYLSSLAPEVSSPDLLQLRQDLTFGRIGPQTYSARMTSSRSDGPHGVLIREALLRPECYDSVDYLSGGGEIAVDICEAISARFGISILNRFEASTTPCIVEFTVQVEDPFEAIASSARYLGARLIGEHSHSATLCVDGGGIEISASQISSVEIVP